MILLLLVTIVPSDELHGGMLTLSAKGARGARARGRRGVLRDLDAHIYSHMYAHTVPSYTKEGGGNMKHCHCNTPLGKEVRAVRQGKHM